MNNTMMRIFRPTLFDHHVRFLSSRSNALGAALQKTIFKPFDRQRCSNKKDVSSTCEAKSSKCVPFSRVQPLKKNPCEAAMERLEAIDKPEPILTIQQLIPCKLPKTTPPVNPWLKTPQTEEDSWAKISRAPEEDVCGHSWTKASAKAATAPTKTHSWTQVAKEHSKSCRSIYKELKSTFVKRSNHCKFVYNEVKTSFINRMRQKKEMAAEPKKQQESCQNRMVCGEQKDSFKKIKQQQPKDEVSSDTKMRAFIGEEVKDSFQKKKADGAEEGETLVIVNDRCKENVFLIPSREEEERVSKSSWVENKCLNPNCDQCTCPIHLSARMKKYQAEMEEKIKPELVDEEAENYGVLDEISHQQTSQDDKPLMIMKLGLDPQALAELKPLSAMLQTKSSTYKDKPIMIMKLMPQVFESEEQQQLPILPIPKEQKLRMNPFLKFPFYCDNSCLDSAKSVDTKGYHSLTSTPTVLPATGICKRLESDTLNKKKAQKMIVEKNRKKMPCEFEFLEPKLGELKTECFRKKLIMERTYEPKTRVERMPCEFVFVHPQAKSNLKIVSVMFDPEQTSKDCVSKRFVFRPYQFKSEKKTHWDQAQEKMQLTPVITRTLTVPLFRTPKSNRYLLNWSLANTKKEKSLSGKQIAYRELCAKEIESKINKLIKVFARNFCLRFYKKKDEYPNDKKSS